MTLSDRIKYAAEQRYAWPGGYPLYALMIDGAALSVDALRDNLTLVLAAPAGSDWECVAIEINWEDESLVCAQTGRLIECAYPTRRYLVAPIADADCASVHESSAILATDDLAEAFAAASHGPHPFGCGILDRETGQLYTGD